MTINEKLANAFSPLREELKELREIAERNTAELKAIVPSEVIDKTGIQLRKNIILNLTDYNETDVRKRDSTIEEAFFIMQDLLPGWEYNEEGSFTEQGAIDQMKKDLSIRESKFRLNVIVGGRLLDLEKGIVNWSNLRRFFYSYKTKAKLTIMFPNYVKGFYDRLATLFAKTSDDRRPYISQAVLDNTEYMDKAIKDAIVQVFGTNSEEGWIRTR